MPAIKIIEEKIFVETGKTAEGRLRIKNSGGGELTGRITSNSRCIRFYPELFTGNSVTISYSVDISEYSKAIGEVIRTSALISSNGGEAIIPVVIKIAADVIKIKDTTINTLKDFYNLAKKNPREAGTLFYSEEFEQWLYRIEFPHIPMFKLLRNDKNTERALDNFFILTNHKKKTDAFIDSGPVNIKIPSYDKTKRSETLRIKKSDWGYIDADISVANASKWLSLNVSRIRTSDFDGTGETEIIYTVNPLYIESNFVYDTIVLNAETTTRVDINVKMEPLFKIMLSNESYFFSDDGYIEVYNNSGGNLRLEIEPKDGFVRFEGKAYFVAETGRIPFKVKMPLLQQKQMDFKKRPYIETEIYIKIFTDAKVINRTEKFLVGYSLLS